MRTKFQEKESSDKAAVKGVPDNLEGFRAPAVRPASSHSVYFIVSC